LSSRPDFGLTAKQVRTLRSLGRPGKVQDFLNGLHANFEENGPTCRSPKSVLEAGEAHCMEGAMLAALAFRMNGRQPLVVDLEAAPSDVDHVIAVFKERGYWGAVSRTNHAVLRYREPVYRSLRELVVSYFHEYFTNTDGKKTLRRYSRPVDLSMFDDEGWTASGEDVWCVPEYLAETRHYKLLEPWQTRGLRIADDPEIDAGRIKVERRPTRTGTSARSRRPR